MKLPALLRASIVLNMLCLYALHAATPQTWGNRGVGGGGALFAPSFSPFNPNELYLACDMSELFHTTNLGASWTVMPFAQILSFHNTLVQFTSDPNILYTLHNSGGTTYVPKKSTDGGATWNRTTIDPTSSGAYNLFADPNDTMRLVLSSGTQMFFSNDGGATWGAAKYTDATGKGCFLAGAFWDGQNIYIGTNAGLLVSNDNGANFGLSSVSGIPSSTEAMFTFCGAKQGSTVRFYCVTLAPGLVRPGYYTWPGVSGFKNVYTLDAGQSSWTNLTANIGLGTGDQLAYVATALNDISTVYVAGEAASSVQQGSTFRKIFKSTNAGTSWASVFLDINNQNIRTGWGGQNGENGWSWWGPPLGFAVCPNDSTRVCISDAGWVHVTTDGGTSWTQNYTSLSHAMNTTNIKGSSYHSVGIEPTSCIWILWADAAHMLSGFADIMLNLSSDGGTNWSFNYTGFPSNWYETYCIVKHPANGTLYAANSNLNGTIYQSVNLADSTIDSLLGRISYSVNNGTTWNLLHDFGHPVVWLAFDPNNSNRMFASVVNHGTVSNTVPGGIYVCSDLQNGAASTWTKLADEVDALSVTRTEGHPFNVIVLNDGTLVSTWSGRLTSASAFTRSAGIFVSTDSGATWADRSYSTGSGANIVYEMHYWTKDITIDPSDATQSTWFVAVGTSWGTYPSGQGGVFKTTDRGLHWTLVWRGAAESVTCSPVNATDLYITTNGKGLLFSSNRNSSSPTAAVLTAYPFSKPARVFFNPYNTNEIWIASNGNGMSVGTLTPGTIQFSAASASVNENAGSATLFVTRTGGTDGAVSATFATSDGTATAGNDYTFTSGTVAFGDGDGASKTITIPITNDTLAEGSETFGVSLANPAGGAALGSPASVLMTILDNPMDAWRFTYFGVNANIAAIAGDSAMPCGDGVTNLAKYAFHLDPTKPVTAGMPVVSTVNVAGSNYLAITFQRPVTATDVSYLVQVSSNLSTAWLDGSSYSASGDVQSNANTTQVTRTTSGGIETISVRDTMPFSGATQRFIRLKITHP